MLCKGSANQLLETVIAGAMEGKQVPLDDTEGPVK
jgi:hypothetical protein